MDPRIDSKRLPYLTSEFPVLAKLAAALAVLLSVFSFGASPASAEPSLVVSPSSGLDPAGAFVVVSGSGFEPNSQLFVMQCRSTSTDDHTCNSVGLRKVTTDASGSFTANAMRLVGRFGATDCTTTTCSVMTSAVSNHSDNRSQDRVAAISFAAPAPPATEPAPTPTLPPAAPAPAPETVPAAPAPETTLPAGDSATTEPEATTPATPTSTTVAEDETRSAAVGDRDTTVADDEGEGEGDAVALAASDPGGSGDGGGSGPLLAIGAVALVAALGGAALALQRRRNPATA